MSTFGFVVTVCFGFEQKKDDRIGRPSVMEIVVISLFAVTFDVDINSHELLGRDVHISLNGTALFSV